MIDIELNAVTDNPLIFPDAVDAKVIEDQVISAGHFHGMPLALAMSYVKAAIPVLASISRAAPEQARRSGHERRLAGVPDRQRGRDRFGLHDRAVHGGGAGQRPGHARASGQRLFDSDQRECRRPRVDGRERSAPRARNDRRPRARARAGTVYRRAGARISPGHAQRRAHARRARRLAGAGGARYPRHRRRNMRNARSSSRKCAR